MGDYNLVTPPIYESPDQVAQLLLQQGFTPAQAAQLTAFSIGNEDPSGNASVVNDNPGTGDYSVGLWQINYYGNLRPGRTQEFGSPESLAASPELQAAAAKSLFAQSGYQPWAADLGKQDVANALPRAVQAVNDVQSGHITVADVASSTASTGYGGSVGSGGAPGYSPASTSLGKVLQEIDGFYNPKVSALPSWTNLLDFGTTSVANGIMSQVLTAADRIVGVLFGVGIVYIGVRMFSEKGSGSGALRTTIRVAGDVATARVGAMSREAVAGTRAASQAGVAQTRAASSAAAQASREKVSQARIDASAAQAQQRAREAAARVAAQNRATANREQAEARRSAEDRNAARRRSDRPRDRGVV